MVMAVTAADVTKRNANQYKSALSETEETGGGDAVRYGKGRLDPNGERIYINDV